MRIQCIAAPPMCHVSPPWSGIVYCFDTDTRHFALNIWIKSTKIWGFNVLRWIEASPRCHPYVGPVVVSIRRVRVAGVWHMLSCLQSVQLSPLMLTQAKYQNTTTQVQRQQRRAKKYWIFINQTWLCSHVWHGWVVINLWQHSIV